MFFYPNFISPPTEDELKDIGRNYDQEYRDQRRLKGECEDCGELRDINWTGLQDCKHCNKGVQSED